MTVNTKIRIARAVETTGMNIKLEQDGSSDNADFTFTPVPDVIAAPTAPPFIDVSVTVGGTLTLKPLTAASSTGEDREVTAVGATGTTDTAVLLNSSDIRFKANTAEGTTSFTYTVETGDGGVTNGGTVIATYRITKVAVAQPGSGTVTVQSKYMVGDIQNDRDNAGPEDRLTGVAPCGFHFNVINEGFNVPDPIIHVDTVLEFGEAPGAHFTIHNEIMPLDRREVARHERVYLYNGERVIVRGRGMFAADGKTRLGMDAVQTPVGYAPPGGGGTYLGPGKNFGQSHANCHVYDTPGTYTVTAHSQKWQEGASTGTLQVEALDPDVVFTAANTHVVSTSSDWSDAPAHSTGNRHTTMAAAISAVNSGSSGTKRRILFRRGEDFAGTSSNQNTNFDVCHVGSYGDPQDPSPILRKGFQFRAETGEYAIWGCDIRPGSYDPADPFNGPNNNASGSAILKTNRCFLTVWDCVTSRQSIGVELQSDGTCNLVVGNSFINGWGDYAFYSAGHVGYIGFCGSYRHQVEDVIQKRGKKNSNPPEVKAADHGPHRLQSTCAQYIERQSSMFSANSWAVSGGKLDYQPCLRLGRIRSYRGPEFETMVIDRCVGQHGSFYGVGATSVPKYMLYHGCTAVMQNGDNKSFNLGVAGIHMFNCMFVQMDTQNFGNRSSEWTQRETPYSPMNDVASMSEKGAGLLNCTLVDLRASPSTFLGWGVDAALDGFTGGGYTYRPFGYVWIANTIVHAPNRTDPTHTASEPLQVSMGWLTNPSYDGGFYESSANKITAHASKNEDHFYYTPLAGSNAIDASTIGHKNPGLRDVAQTDGSFIPSRDFYMNLRPAVTAQGYEQGPDEVISSGMV